MNKTLEQIIVEGLEYYCEDTSRRCTSTEGTCFYSGESIGKPEIEGCFIGRMLTPEQRLEWDKAAEETGYDNSIAISDWEKYKVSPPPQIIEDNLNLFQALQDFHDSAFNWNKTGLTHIGITRLNIIIKNYNLNKEPFLNSKIINFKDMYKGKSLGRS